MNLLDVVIIAFVFGALGNGYRRGFSLSSLSYGGLVAGTAIGAFLAPLVKSGLQIGPNSGPFVGLAVLFIAALVGSSIGYSLGEPLRLRVLRSRGHARWDSVTGAIFSAVTVLATSWFLGLTFADVQIRPVAVAIKESRILQTLDSIFPKPPGFLTGVQHTIAGVPYPRVFDSLNPGELPGPVTVDPAVAHDPAVLNAAKVTVKVRSRGCGGEVFGSGYPVADNYLISNAHVVAGTEQGSHRVLVPDGRSLSATVELFDPNRDVAILYVPGLRLTPLPSADATHGTSGATIGYPGGGNERIAGAAVRGRVTAVGQNIYGDAQVTRQIYILSADIQPGNSGGPMVDASGRAIGVVFANSTTDPSEGYALTDEEVAPDVRAGVGRKGPEDPNTQTRCAQ